MNDVPGGLSAAAAGGRLRRRSISAAVEKTEDMRKPERFFGYRKVELRAATEASAAAEVDPLQVHQNGSTRLGAFRFGLKGIESCPYSPVGCTLTSSKTGQHLYSLFAKRKENAVIPFKFTKKGR